MMRGLVALGLEAVQAQQVPFLSDGMCNGVRWGLVGGQQRLLAADQVRSARIAARRQPLLPPGLPPVLLGLAAGGGIRAQQLRSFILRLLTCSPAHPVLLVCIVQSGYVYVFELPPAVTDIASSSSSGGSNGAGGDDGSLRPEQLLCAGLGQPSQYWQMRPVSGGGRAATAQACHGVSGVCSGRSLQSGLDCYCSATVLFCAEEPHRVAHAQLQVNFFGATQHALGARVKQQQPPVPPTAGAATRRQAAAAAHSGKAAGTYKTAALGPFPFPCNLAAASPDGRWIAGKRAACVAAPTCLLALDPMRLEQLMATRITPNFYLHLMPMPLVPRSPHLPPNTCLHLQL